MNKENNCYGCKYRGDVAGSAHSCCEHPKIANQKNDPLSSIMAIFASVGRMAPMNASPPFKLACNPHGVKHGWCNWPWNFDPIWIDECEGYKEKGGD